VNGKKLEQGNILRDLPMIEIPEDLKWPPSDSSQEIKIDTEISAIDGIIITQSCDLETRKIEFVAFCPIDFLDSLEDFKKDEKREDLRKGRHTGLHLLDKYSIPNHETDFMVVNFKLIFSLPLKLVENIAMAQQDRITLISPYREHLSQSFARFFMRVGLPADIPPFKNK
jgi:hypothetical protein